MLLLSGSKAIANITGPNLFKLALHNLVFLVFYIPIAIKWQPIEELVYFQWTKLHNKTNLQNYWTNLNKCVSKIIVIVLKCIIDPKQGVLIISDPL